MCEKEWQERGGEEGRGRGREGFTAIQSGGEERGLLMWTAWGPILHSPGLPLAVWPVSHFSHTCNRDTNSTYFLELL